MVTYQRLNTGFIAYICTISLNSSFFLYLQPANTNWTLSQIQCQMCANNESLFIGFFYLKKSILLSTKYVSLPTSMIWTDLKLAEKCYLSTV